MKYAILFIMLFAGCFGCSVDSSLTTPEVQSNEVVDQTTELRLAMQEFSTFISVGREEFGPKDTRYINTLDLYGSRVQHAVTRLKQLEISEDQIVYVALQGVELGNRNNKFSYDKATPCYDAWVSTRNSAFTTFTICTFAAGAINPLGFPVCLAHLTATMTLADDTYKNCIRNSY